MSAVQLAVVGTARAEWVSRIQARWQASVEAILEVGRLLLDAKAALPHGDFEAMVKEDLHWSPPTARRLMAVAEHPVLGDRTHVHALPPSWGTLYELTKLPEPVLVRALDDGTIAPAMTRREVARLRGVARPAAPDVPLDGPARASRAVPAEAVSPERSAIVDPALGKIIWNASTVLNQRFDPAVDRVMAELAILLPNIGDGEEAARATILAALMAARDRVDRAIAAWRDDRRGYFMAIDEAAPAGGQR